MYGEISVTHKCHKICLNCSHAKCLIQQSASYLIWKIGQVLIWGVRCGPQRADAEYNHLYFQTR